MEAAAARSGGFGGGVEWASGQWRADRRLVVVARSASVVESLVEHGLRSVVKIRAQPVLIDAWLAIGNVGLWCLWIGDEEGWAKIFKCVMFVRSRLVVGDG